jgi:hypothetical protein
LLYLYHLREGRKGREVRWAGAREARRRKITEEIMADKWENMGGEGTTTLTNPVLSTRSY